MKTSNNGKSIYMNIKGYILIKIKKNKKNTITKEIIKIKYNKI